MDRGRGKLDHEQAPRFEGFSYCKQTINGNTAHVAEYEDFLRPCNSTAQFAYGSCHDDESLKPLSSAKRHLELR